MPPKDIEDLPPENREGLPPTWYWADDDTAREYPGVYGAPVAELNGSRGRRDWVIVRAWAIYTITPLKDLN